MDERLRNHNKFRDSTLAERGEAYKQLAESIGEMWHHLPNMGGFTPPQNMGPVEYHLLSAVDDLQSALESALTALWDLADDGGERQK